MPPRSSLTSSFSLADSNNEVVCPLRNQDGSNCRKRCIGEKRYRSMQEHIRRAHPEHYISKLPATEESFHLMISTAPSERRHADHSTAQASQGFNDRNAHYRNGASSPGTPRHADDRPPLSAMGAAGAAAVLAELHGVKSERACADLDAAYNSDVDGQRRARTSIELPPLHLANHAITSDPFSGRPRDTLPSLADASPPGRSSTLPPLQRPLGPSRPRKSSVTKRGQVSHKKKNSRGSTADWLRRMANEDLVRPLTGHDRKAQSAEPSAEYGKRWEDLIDAADQAASMAGDVDEDRTPMPQSPVSNYRSPIPHYAQQHQYHQQQQQHQLPAGSYQASPLQQALTPPSYHHDSIDPFPSVESGESGDNFHMRSRGLSDSSPTDSSHNIQIYCAMCHNTSLLRNSYACTECICGLCRICVEVLMAEQGANRKCPRCATIGGRFKPFQLDIR